MGFRFRYEAVLSYRRHLKERAELEFASAQRKLREARDALARCHASLHEAIHMLEKRLREKISSDELRNYHEYMAGLKLRISDLTALVARCEEEVRKRREDLVARAKALKVMEKLKEKDLDVWNRAQSLLERNQMNEVSVLRHGRQFI